MDRGKKIAESAIIYHLLVVMLLLVPHSIYTYYIAKKSISLYFLNMAVIDGFILLSVYINLFWLIPVFHKRKNYAVYFPLVGLLVALFIYISCLTTLFISRKLAFGDEPLFFVIVSSFFNVTQYLLISFFLFSLKEKFEQKKKMDEIEVDKLKTEINYLRAQINPHFLFNTLNNLYGLALEKSDKTPEIIIRLSKIMEYMLYEPEDARVHLDKDIENLVDYIAIEKIRQGNNAEINFRIEGLISRQKIVPLLLLPLIENGFKHGVNRRIHNAYLDINLLVSADSLVLDVVNNNSAKDEEAVLNKGGIGLTNLKRRLELFYPGKHQLETRQDTNQFEAHLKIYLA